MFGYSSYEQITLSMPPQGMNKFIAPNALPKSFAFHLENILPSPLGVGQVRCGTRKKNTVGNPDSSIIDGWKFVDEDGSIQAPLYVQSYAIDDTISNAEVVNQTTFNFDSDNATRYNKDTYIKVSYSLNAVTYTFYPKIEELTVVGDAVLITIINSAFPPSEDITIESIGYPVGRIYVYDYAENTFSGILKDNLSVACIPRATTFNQTLLICNGVNNVMYWDGEVLDDVYDFVKEVSAVNIVRINANNFSFTSLPGFIQGKYYNGNSIEINVNGVSTTLVIANVAAVGALITITTVGVLPAWVGGDEVELFYKDYPPKFNYIYSGTDRPWALGPGPAGIGWRASNDALRVYYPYRPNSIFNWFNENTKTVPSIDVSNKHGIQDNLEAICQVNGLTAFVGRSRTQVWSGSVPGDGKDIGNLGDFAWQSNIDVGVAHGNLLIDMPNDVYLVSKSGLKSASTLNAAKQFSANSFNAVDPSIVEFMSSVMGSDSDYRACRSFKYNDGKFCGFKIGKNKILTSMFETSLYAWTFFSGDFQKSNSFVDVGDSLLLFIGNSIYQYADGNDGSQTLYGDNNGSSLISFSWIPSLTDRAPKGFSSKRCQLILSYPSSFPTNNENLIYLTVNGDYPNIFEKKDLLQLEEKGDQLGQGQLMPVQNYQDGYFKLGIPYSLLIKRFKFSSISFWVMLNGYTKNGPLYFREIKLFGG